MNSTGSPLDDQQKWRERPALRRSFFRANRHDSKFAALRESISRDPVQASFAACEPEDPESWKTPLGAVGFVLSRAKALTLDARSRPYAVPPGWSIRSALPYGRLEESTLSWRYLRARELRARAAEKRAELRALVERWGADGDAWERTRMPLYQRSDDDAELVARLAERLRLQPNANGLTVEGWARDEIAARFAERYTESDASALVDQIRKAETSARWHEQRAAAQASRFDTIRTCGSKTLSVHCLSCADQKHAGIPCRCGVVRVCPACADHRAGERRRRIAVARLRALELAGGLGLFRKKRDGGKATEKMLTLTLPHFVWTGVDMRTELGKELLRPHMNNSVAARIAALRLAWPKFMRSLRRWLKKRDRQALRGFTFYRLFEWTRGDDGDGHPHFHIYLLSTFLPKAMVRAKWIDALRSIGVPEMARSCRLCTEAEPGTDPGCPGLGEEHVNIKIQRLRGVGDDWSALRELVKSGNWRAIETRLGSLRAPGSPGLDAVDYADGWTMSDVKGWTMMGVANELEDAADTRVRRDLYIALEGRRLAQGARGFLLPRAELFCECCGWGSFVAVVSDGLTPRMPATVGLFGSSLVPRGPPS